jgi:uncharacterized protein (TIGR00730 family)
MQRVCVFCGSSPGSHATYLLAAEALGRRLVERGIGLVYGGAGVGLMGRLAETVLAGGGEVIGVIPEALVRMEVAHPVIPDLRVVGSMHERKAVMAELADGFIAMPGGLGTVEEILEILTWGQLGIHEKPCGVLNVRGYFETLVGFLDHAVDQLFIKAEHRDLVLVADEPERLLDLFEAWQAPVVDKAAWILSMNDR